MWLLSFWAAPEDLYGLELEPRRAQVAQLRLPSSHIDIGSATQMPYPAEFFDLVHCASLFTSILSDDVRGKIALEMMRVLKPGGLLMVSERVSEKLEYGKDGQPRSKGISVFNMKKLFPDVQFRIRPSRLNPKFLKLHTTVAAGLCRFKSLNLDYYYIGKKEMR